MTPNMIGAYGEWAAQTMQDPPRLSFRQPMFGNVEAWRAVARARFRETLMGPGGARVRCPRCGGSFVVAPATMEAIPQEKRIRDTLEKNGTPVHRS